MIPTSVEAAPSRPAVQIRGATVDDLPAIVRLLADDTHGASRERPEAPLARGYLDAFDAIEAQPGIELLVAEMDGHVVGCLQLCILPGLSRIGMTRALIEAVRVKRSLRGRRIGEAMVLHAVAQARSRGCGLVQLTTDRSRHDAHRFYERLGFEATHVGMKLVL